MLQPVVNSQKEIIAMSTSSTHTTIDSTATLATQELGRVHGGALAARWPALLCAFLGAVIVYGVGFSNLSVAHNAAHDTRHTMTFPCH
jgi:cobalt transporter subunit CbtB